MSLIFLFSRKAVALQNLKAVKCLSAEDADAKPPAHAANLLEIDDISGSGRGYDGTAEEYSQMQPTDSAHHHYNARYLTNNTESYWDQYVTNNSLNLTKNYAGS